MLRTKKLKWLKAAENAVGQFTSFCSHYCTLGNNFCYSWVLSKAKHNHSHCHSAVLCISIALGILSSQVATQWHQCPSAVFAACALVILSIHSNQQAFYTAPLGYRIYPVTNYTLPPSAVCTYTASEHSVLPFLSAIEQNGNIHACICISFRDCWKPWLPFCSIAV